MKLKLLSFLIVATSAHAEIPPGYAVKVANAIYRVEGGPKAKVPYGILSVKVRNADHAREICLRTITNNYARWEKAGKPGLFLDFLANRYCPASVDPIGNRNWKKNIKAIVR